MIQTSASSTLRSIRNTWGFCLKCGLWSSRPGFCGRDQDSAFLTSSQAMLLLLRLHFWLPKIDFFIIQILCCMFSSPTKSCTIAPQILFTVQPFLVSSAHLYFLVSLSSSDKPCYCCCCCFPASWSSQRSLSSFSLKVGYLPVWKQTTGIVPVIESRPLPTTAKWVKNSWQCS